mgnify:CR=1 FL=1
MRKSINNGKLILDNAIEYECLKDVPEFHEGEEDNCELPEWAKDIPELHHVCEHTKPKDIAEEFKHFIAFNGQMNSCRYTENIKAEIIEGMFRRLNVTPEQIRKAIVEEVIKWS